VAISIPVIFSNRLITVTNMTAMKSPASEGNAPQAKPESASKFHGRENVVAACGLNIQPAVCTEERGKPLSAIARYTVPKEANKRSGKTNGLRYQVRATKRATATATPASTFATLDALNSASKLCILSCRSVTTSTAPETTNQPVAPRNPPITG